MKTTSTQVIEIIRAHLVKSLPKYHYASVNGIKFYPVGHDTPVGTRYNMQVGKRYYQELTLSGVAAAIYDNL